MNLTEQTIAVLSGWVDPIGILSVYVGKPIDESNIKPTSPIELRNQLRDIATRAKATLPHSQWMKVYRRLDELSAELDQMMDPASSGRGRALFAAMSDARVETVAVQLPLPTRAIFDRSAFVLPLVAALDEGRTCGLVSVQRDGVLVLEWRLDTTEELASHQFVASNLAEWREKRGPADPNPMRGQQAAVHADLFERRMDANRQRFLRGMAKEVSDLIANRGWQRVAVFGDARLGHALLTSLPANEDIEIVTDNRVLDESARATIRDRATVVLHDAQKRRELELVRAAKANSGSAGRTSLGLHESLVALNHGRVEHLLIDPTISRAGFRTSDGQLFAADAPPPAEAGLEVEVEPHLVDSMVRRALATHARVTPVEELAAIELKSCEGVAAMLRW